MGSTEGQEHSGQKRSFPRTAREEDGDSDPILLSKASRSTSSERTDGLEKRMKETSET
jgi:hypothetical protein